MMSRIRKEASLPISRKGSAEQQHAAERRKAWRPLMLGVREYGHFFKMATLGFHCFFN